MSTGTPTINFGYGLGDYDHPHFKNSYIVPQIVEHGVDGFISDDAGEISSIIRELLLNTKLARYISRNARKKILSRFGKHLAVEQWATFFRSEVGSE